LKVKATSLVIFITLATPLGWGNSQLHGGLILSHFYSSFRMLGFRCSAGGGSGVGHKRERSDNQEFDPLEKTLGHKVAGHKPCWRVDKKSS
jgi:hypothetical protein